eukprot:scaffold1674_cov340-Prasinococcus_capsulatus_cf.AAC.8
MRWQTKRSRSARVRRYRRCWGCSGAAPGAPRASRTTPHFDSGCKEADPAGSAASSSSSLALPAPSASATAEAAAAAAVRRPDWAPTRPREALALGRCTHSLWSMGTAPAARGLAVRAAPRPLRRPRSRAARAQARDERCQAAEAPGGPRLGQLRGLLLLLLLILGRALGLLARQRLVGGGGAAAVVEFIGRAGAHDKLAGLAPRGAAPARRRLLRGLVGLAVAGGLGRGGGGGGLPAAAVAVGGAGGSGSCGGGRRQRQRGRKTLLRKKGRRGRSRGMRLGAPGAEDLVELGHRVLGELEGEEDALPRTARHERGQRLVADGRHAKGHHAQHLGPRRGGGGGGGRRRRRRHLAQHVKGAELGDAPAERVAGQHEALALARRQRPQPQRGDLPRARHEPAVRARHRLRRGRARARVRG